MKWFKAIVNVILICVMSIMIMDAIMYYFFPEYVQRLSPTKYKSARECRSAGAFYMSHSERGFDIKPGIRGISCFEPWESEPYIAWGNTLGCFDSEKDKGYRPDIYLAGDSYTWGYAPFEAKFGTILENRTGRNVLKCGVSNTGQRHQFSKFIEISEKLNQYPEIVVVNYASNDMENDYVYPHSTTINNQLIEDTYLTSNEEGMFEILRVDEETLLDDAVSRDEKYRDSPFNTLLRYSASSNILYHIITGYRGAMNETGKPAVKERHWFYYLLILLEDAGKEDGLPIYSLYGEENREILLRWKKHSQDNNYRLIISLIPNRAKFGVNYYRNLERFLSNNEIEYYNFEKYLDLHNIDAADIYWTYDNHFNLKGNADYERYLEDIVQGAQVYTE